MRRSTVSPFALGRPGRLVLLAGAAVLGVGLLAAPASADAAGPAAPVVTPSTTGTVPVGTPMTMTVEPGSATDHVYGYAWSWQQIPGGPVYGALPSCPSTDPAAANGGVHFVCGAKATVRVSPEEPPSATFSVWAFDAAGNRSPATSVPVGTIDAGESLIPVAHQWTTDQWGTVPSPASCGVASVTVTCVPDTAGVDATHPNGAHPLLLPPGTRWDGSGGFMAPGVLTFGQTSNPAGTTAAVVDTRSTFTAGAWLTPTASPSGTAATALAQEGLTGSGFELGLTGDGRWEFRVHTPTGEASAVAPSTAMPGNAVYVAGVWDSVNKEVRLYVDGGLASVVGFAPHATKAQDGPATVGARLSSRGVTEKWTGQIGNPVLVPAPLTTGDLAELKYESFFGVSDLG